VPLRLSAVLGSYDGAFVMVRGVGLELLQRWCWRGGLSALRRQRVHWCRYCVTAHLVQRQATNRDPKPNTEKDDIPSFHDWIRGGLRYRTWPAGLGSAQAATIILLSFAAAAIGMMVFGIEFQIIEHASV
jgi:hypothetical protein